jgi:hypothetical protein
LSGAKYFTKVDLKSRYHQNNIQEGEEWNTMLKMKEMLYKSLVMPFGLTNAPNSFIRLMTEVLKPYLGKFVVVYLDDVLVFRKTKEKHMMHLKQMPKWLKQREVVDKSAKVFFHEKRIGVLGICEISSWIEDGSREGENHCEVAHTIEHILGKKLSQFGKLPSEVYSKF